MATCLDGRSILPLSRALVSCLASALAAAAPAAAETVGVRGKMLDGASFEGRIVYALGLPDLDALTTHGEYEDPSGSLSIRLSGETYETAAGPLVLTTLDDVRIVFPFSDLSSWLDEVRILSTSNHPVDGVGVRLITIVGNAGRPMPPNPWLEGDALPLPSALAERLVGADLRIHLDPTGTLRGTVTEAWVIPEPATAWLLAAGLAALAPRGAASRTRRGARSDRDDASVAAPSA